MSTTKKKALNALTKKKSFSVEDARRAGISHPTLSRMLKRGIVTRLARGLYSVAGEEPLGSEGDYSVVKKKFGSKAVVGGLTALSHYHLIDEVPMQIWILVPPETRSIDKKYRLLRTKKNLNTGVIKTNEYKIVSLERALVDGLIYSSKIGERVVKTAILRAIKNKLTTQGKIVEMAKKLKALKIIDKEWQSILAGLAQ